MVKNAIELFCGAGGMSTGFRDAGFRILGGIDINPVYLTSFKANHPRVRAVNLDISHLTLKSMQQLTGGAAVHIVLGGPPCQSFSTAVKRHPSDRRNYLWRHFLRVVSYVRPEWFVMENVVGLLSAKNKRAGLIKDDIIRKARRLGYKVDYRILDAADFRVPQFRKRVVFLGTRLRGEDIIFPLGDSVITPVKKVLLRREAVDRKYFYSPKLIRGFVKREKRNRRQNSGFRWQFLDPERPSYTIPARYGKDGANALVAYSKRSIRMLTEVECAKIQGFPDDYIFHGNKQERYEQIGNAVPPPLARAVAKVLYAKGRGVVARNTLSRATVRGLAPDFFPSRVPIGV